MKVLQNITAAMNHNSTTVQQLKTTMANLTLNSLFEDNQLKNQEDEILRKKEEVNNFVCNCEYENGVIGVLAVGLVYQTMKILSFTKSRTGQEMFEWDARNNGIVCVDAKRLTLQNVKSVNGIPVKSITAVSC